MHEAFSFLYRPVNALLEPVLGFKIPDHIIMGVFILLIIAIGAPLIRKSLSLENPGKFQLFLEWLIEALTDLMEDVIGHGQAKKYLAIIGTFAFFIFLANIMGLVFFLNPPTSNPNTTFALSITAFIFYNIEGLKKHGPGYVKHFMGPMLAVAVIIFPVEIISHMVRALSLGLRLFGNIFGEHTVSGIMAGLAAPWTGLFVPWPMMLIGIIAATMQTFIFIVLTMAYIGGAVGEEH